MLEAKDTVMSKEQLNVYWSLVSGSSDVRRAIEAQAEISFKIGKTAGVAESLIPSIKAIEASRKEGRREVVEELGLHCYLWHDENNKQHICIDMDTWQVKLKEWEEK